MALLGFEGLTLAKHITIGGQGQNLRDANTADAPDKVAPRDGKGLGARGRAAGWLAAALVLSCGSPARRREAAGTSRGKGRKARCRE